MKNFVVLSIVGLVLLQPAVEAIFLCNIAVGAVIVALADGQDSLLDLIFPQRRSQSYGQRPRYDPYIRQNYYDPKPTYNTQPATMYYSAQLPGFLGKRSAPEIDMALIGGYKREVVE